MHFIFLLTDWYLTVANRCLMEGDLEDTHGFGKVYIGPIPKQNQDAKLMS